MIYLEQGLYLRVQQLSERAQPVPLQSGFSLVLVCCDRLAHRAAPNTVTAGQQAQQLPIRFAVL